MQRLAQLDMHVQERVFLKDPSTTELGRRIIERSIGLIDELGFERFTFAKLAHALGTAESSIYRYFENKHLLLVYLIGWYWSWREYKLVFDTANLPDNKQRLERAIRSLTETVEERGAFSHVDLRALYRIAKAESPKAYLVKEVDARRRDGHFSSFGRLCDRLRELILLVRRDHPFPAALACTIAEGSLDLHFFHEHIPVLSGFGRKDRTADFLLHLAQASIAHRPRS